jgi:stage II sporulation protein AA (anti-sigma F factor antagonist)
MDFFPLDDGERVNPGREGHGAGMESSEQQPGTQQPIARDEHTAPTVTVDLDGDTARITVDGELTDAARRPLVREVTDLLLARHSLHRIDLDLRAVRFVNSAGVAVLVQLQKLVAPRAIELVLVAPPTAVVRPLQLTGLWHRFTIQETEERAG